MTGPAQDELGPLLRFARQSLHALFAPDAQPAGGDALGTAPRPGPVNVMLRRDGWLRGSMTSTNPSRAAAIVEAVGAAANDPRFAPVTFAEIEQIVIELWVQTGSVPMPPDPEVIGRTFRLGIDGIGLAVDGREGFYKPSVAITASVNSGPGLLARLCRKLGVAENAWAAGDAVIHRSAWLHGVEARDRAEGHLQLERLRPASSALISRDRVASAVRRCVRHMLDIRRADGSLGYQYNPLRDEWTAEESRVRSAGCAYALARSAIHPVTASVPGLRHGVAGLLGYIRSTMIDTEAGLFVPERDPERAWGKLGATALTFLALQYVRPDGEFCCVADQLRRTVLRQQRGDGSFSCRLQDDTVNDAEQDYFPGEALLALAHSAVRLRCLQTVRAIDDAFAFYLDRFRRTPSTAFVPWQAEAWTLVCSQLRTGEFRGPACGEIAAFVFAQIDWLLPAQYGWDDDTPAHLRGGFVRPYTPTICSASHLEAILHGLNLAAVLGDTWRVSRYRAAARACLRFVLDLQVPQACDFLFPFPRHIVGAAAGSPLTFRFRCDYDQHFVTALLTAYDSAALWCDD